MVVDWPSGRQTLTVQANDFPPYGAIYLLGARGESIWQAHFESTDHALHTLTTGVVVPVPSVQHTLFARLVREKRAEVVHGPHCDLSWPDSKLLPLRFTDNGLYTWNRPKTRSPLGN